MDFRVNPDIFRAYDIRGLVGKDITPRFAELVGKASGTYLLGQDKGKTIVVGMDNRISSNELKEQLIKGLLSTGCDVIDIGLCTSPMLYQAVYEGGGSGGVMISASHNPKEYNGFKVVAEKAIPVSGNEILQIRDILVAGDFASGNGLCTIEDTEEKYLQSIQKVIKLERKLKVVVDTGNAVAGKFAPNLFRQLGCDVVEVFCELDGNFPNHVPNPEHERNLLEAKKRVTETQADIGIGIDGDGDRVGLIDEKGNFLSADYAIILLVKDYLKRHPGETILVDVKSSQNVIDTIKNNGGKPLLYKTGHSLIKKKMRAAGINMGGEFSGHLYVFENFFPFDDALYAAAKILEILSQSDFPLSSRFSDLSKLFSTDLIELGCPDASKFDVMKEIVSAFSESYVVNTIDGVRIEFNNGWATLRASNTTPYLTFRAEANTRSSLKQILIDVQETLLRFPSIELSVLDTAIHKV